EGVNRRSIRPPPREAPLSAARLLERRLRRNESCNFAQEFVDGLDTLVAVFPIPHRNLPALLFAVPYDQHVRNLLQLRVADLEVDLLAALVHRRPNSGSYQTIANGAAVFELAGCDR